MLDALDWDMARKAPVWSHQAAFEDAPISASQARRFVTDRLHEHGLPYLVEPVRLVASELATNAVLHAKSAFYLTLDGSNDTVMLTVRDGSLRHPTPLTPQAMDTTGRGLRIVGALSRRWGVDTDAGGAKSVWVAFEIAQPAD